MSPVLMVSDGRREKWPEIRDNPQNTGDLAAYTQRGGERFVQNSKRSLRVQFYNVHFLILRAHIFAKTKLFCTIARPVL